MFVQYTYPIVAVYKYGDMYRLVVEDAVEGDFDTRDGALKYVLKYFPEKVNYD